LPAALFLRDLVEYLERPPPREEGVTG
jgi:hypothetical protein